jgi:hypothetical protein
VKRKENRRSLFRSVSLDVYNKDVSQRLDFLLLLCLYYVSLSTIEEDGLLIPRNTGALMCGMKGMADAVKDLLSKAGVFEGRILSKSCHRMKSSQYKSQVMSANSSTSLPGWIDIEPTFS